MKLLLLSTLALFLTTNFAQAAERCLPAKSCQSGKQCYDSPRNKWFCVVKSKPGKPVKNGPGRPGRDYEPIDRETNRRLNDALDSLKCSGAPERCRDRSSSDNQDPYNELERALEGQRCASGGDCIRP